ncbi:MAG: hypothetical protein A4S09_17400 [Proteobacteria bacterium SG_bin7]|nr:MAG: hypothetical protein A4S09_17400 [Proteobacteria bacterium SG_bin7]
MRRPKKKVPSDYPQFAFRLNNDSEKSKLIEQINRTVESLNEKIDPDSKPYSKSEVIIKALSIGLSKLGGK